MPGVLSAETAAGASRQAPWPHIVLVGLPGAGKSTVGALAASALHSEFLDFDVEIQHRTRRSIQDIFAEMGEAAFREMEHQLTEEVSRAAPMVLAPGGGWVTNPANLALLRPRARIIHLRVSVETALRRLGPNTVARPLLSAPDPRQALRRLWKEREPIYRAADAEIDTEGVEPQQVTKTLTALASGWGWPVG